MRRRDEGSAVVDVVLVSVLVLSLFLLVVQVGLVLHVRNVLVASAAEGARYGAAADRTADEAADRTRAAVTEAVGRRVTDRMTYTATAVVRDGLPSVTIPDDPGHHHPDAYPAGTDQVPELNGGWQK